MAHPITVNLDVQPTPHKPVSPELLKAIRIAEEAAVAAGDQRTADRLYAIGVGLGSQS